MTAFITAAGAAATTSLTSRSSAWLSTSTIPRRAKRVTAARPSRCNVPSMVLDPVSATTHLLSDNPAFLQKIADAFNSLGLPEPVTTYGHPALMAFMVLGMGLPGAVFGWKGRLNEDKKAGVKQKQLHENIMLAFFLLAFLGGTGGTLAVAMQGYDVWQSPHAISALVVLILLGANSVLAYSGFTIGTDGTPKGRLAGRKFHAYFGAVTMAAFFVHAALGVNILLG